MEIVNKTNNDTEIHGRRQYARVAFERLSCIHTDSTNLRTRISHQICVTCDKSWAWAWLIPARRIVEN